MMKRITAMLLCLAVIFSFFVIPVSAEENKPTVSVSIIDGELIDFTDSLSGFSIPLPIVGWKFIVGISLKNFEDLKSGTIKIEYNDNIMTFNRHDEIRDWIYDGWETIYEIERDYLSADLTTSENGLMEIQIESDGRGYDSIALCCEYFRCINKGNCNFTVTVSGFVDSNGEEIDVVVENRFPEQSHYFEEIPSLKFDSEKCLAYGSPSGRETTIELACPMTVKEFIDSLDYGNGTCLIKDVDGKILGENDMIPTGGVLELYYADSLIRSADIILIGDVTCDGKITAADARKILRIAARLEILYYNGIDILLSVAANPSQSKEITAKDARSVLRYAALIDDCYIEWFRYHKLLHRYDYNLYTEA